jgi:hypothetical protein
LKRAVLVTTRNIQKELEKTMKKHEPDDGAKDLALIMSFLRATRWQQRCRVRQLALNKVAVPATVPEDRRPRRQL